MTELQESEYLEDIKGLKNWSRMAEDELSNLDSDNYHSLRQIDRAINDYHQAVLFGKSALLSTNNPNETQEIVAKVWVSLAKSYETYGLKNFEIQDYMVDGEALACWRLAIDEYEEALSYCSTQTVYILNQKIQSQAKMIGAMFYSKSEILEALTMLKQLVQTISEHHELEKDALIEELLYTGGIIAGEYADKLDEQQATDYYQLAKTSLCLAQNIRSDAETAKSILSMLVRNYHANPNKNKQSLIEAKDVFENLSHSAPETIGEMSYNRACIAGLENNVTETIKYLNLSKQHNCLPSRTEIMADNDFYLLKDDPSFIKWLAEN